MSAHEPARPPRRVRAATVLARLPGRRLPLKGWTVVTEQLHRRTGAPGGDVVHRSAWGCTLRLDLDDYTQRCIYYDAYETEELDLARRLLQPGDVMVDVGANVGIFTLVAAAAVGPAGEVHAFEPVPANHERLAENVALNGLSNVVLHRVAVGDEEGTTTLGIPPETARASGGTMSGFFVVGLTDRAIAAPLVRLDGPAAGLPAGGRQIRLVKLDVEGFEPRVLAGMGALLATQRVDFLLLEVSVYNLRRQGLAIADVVRPLESAGYSLFRLGARRRLRRWRYRGEPSVPDRSRAPSLMDTIVAGLQDRERHFNLFAIRGGHPALAGAPEHLRPAALSRAPRSAGEAERRQGSREDR
jgi:FkbM family methyltransferase